MSYKLDSEFIIRINLYLLQKCKLYPVCLHSKNRITEPKTGHQSGVSDCTFSIMYGHYGLFGFTGYSVKDGLSTTDTTSTTYKTSEEEQVYVRTWQQKTGDRFTGSLKCSWK